MKGLGGGTTPTPRQFVWLSKQRNYKMGSLYLYESKQDNKGQKRTKELTVDRPDKVGIFDLQLAVGEEWKNPRTGLRPMRGTKVKSSSVS